VLERPVEGRVRLVDLDDDGAERGVAEVARVDLPRLVAEREREHPRWVWDDTTRWYPDLLAHGVRVRRCTDLRLCHAILRRSPAVGGEAFAAADARAREWDGLAPVDPSPVATLFDDVDPGDALDPVAEWRRQREAIDHAGDAAGGLALLLAAESSGALVAVELTHAGLPWRADVHDRLLVDLVGPRPSAGARPARLERLLAQARAALDAPDLNPDSPPELVRRLRRAGLPVASSRSHELERIEHPAIPPLLEYKKLARLLAANGWNWLEEWVHGGRFRPVYVPGGVVTGRWASNGGGALQLPAQVRPAVVADPGRVLVVADAAQLEPRVLAGLAHDTAMARAARSRDLYQAMVDSGAVPTREQAKYGMLGAIYGGTRGESGRMLPRIARAYPRAFELVEQAARAGERGERVRTLLGRGSPQPGAGWAAGVDERSDEEGADAPDESARGDRRAWGRFTRNFVVQGTAAEWALSWLATLRNRLWELGDGDLVDRPHLVFFLHDEVVVHTPAELADAVADAVRASAAEAGRLLFGDFPLDFPLDVAVVTSYADAG